MIWIHKSVSNKIENYRSRDRILEIWLKIYREYLTVLEVYVPTEGREELSEEFCETLQKILDEVNKIEYILSIGRMNTRAGNNKGTNIVGTNG